MAFKWADRVKENAAAPGTGNLTLAGVAPGGYFTFASFMANADTTFYTIVDNLGAAEVGIGSWGTGGIFTRTAVFASTNAGAKVNFTNAVQIFCDAAATGLVMLISGILQAANGGAIDGRNLTNIQASAITGIVAAANGGAGATTGILKGNGAGVVSAAVSNADYAPPTIISNTGPSGSGVPGQLWVQV